MRQVLRGKLKLKRPKHESNILKLIVFELCTKILACSAQKTQLLLRSRSQIHNITIRVDIVRDINTKKFESFEINVCSFINFNSVILLGSLTPVAELKYSTKYLFLRDFQVKCFLGQLGLLTFHR